MIHSNCKTIRKSCKNCQSSNIFLTFGNNSELNTAVPMNQQKLSFFFIFHMKRMMLAYYGTLHFASYL